MKLSYYFKLAFRNLFRRKFRNIFTIASLTVAGLLLAALLAIQGGLSDFLNNQLDFLAGRDILNASTKVPVTFSFGPQQTDEPVEVKEDSQVTFGIEVPVFKQEDVEKIKSVEGVSEVDYSIYLDQIPKSIKLSDGVKKYVVSLSYNSFEIKDKTKLLAGQNLEKNDQGLAIVSSKYLKVFGASNAEDLLGKEAIIDGQRNYLFKIVGVSDKTAKGNPDFILPFADAATIARDDIGDEELYINKFGSSLLVKAENEGKVKEIDAAIEKLGFDSTNAQEASESITGAVRWFFRALAIIAFVISSAFIFSTMSVAVKDRVKEIGILKAVGATKGTIRILFSIEALLIGLISGVLSIILSVGWFTAFNFYSHQTFLKDLPEINILVLSWLIPLQVLGTTILVTVISAFWPAFRASSIDPIKAIRNE